jgi:hypothetical protein
MIAPALAQWAREVFPRLTALATEATGEGPTIKVRFTKREVRP